MTWTPNRIVADFLLDPSVKELIAVFENAGHGDAFRFVGGCVRNALMNLPVADIDIATVLVPETVRDIFTRAGYNVHDTGIAHGTVTVVVKGTPFEVTTLRRDVETDGRRAVIEYSTDWRDDAERRDFRCNALYMDQIGNLFDYVGGGARDAMDRKLVFVGDADLRIREDYLRVLRFFRFQATLGASGDDVGLEACGRLKAGMSTLSGERLHAEMMKLLAAKRPQEALMNMIDTGVYEYVLQGKPDMDVFRRVCSVSTDPEVRLAALFAWDVEAANSTFARWKVSRALEDRVLAALAGPVCMGREDLKLETYRVGADTVSDRMILTWAEEYDPDMNESDLHEMIAEVRADVPVFPLRGADVIEAGMKPGPMIGKVLREVEDWWIKSGYPPVEVCRKRLTQAVSEAA